MPASPDLRGHWEGAGPGDATQGFRASRGPLPGIVALAETLEKWKILLTNMSEGSVMDTKRPEGP